MVTFLFYYFIIVEIQQHEDFASSSNLEKKIRAPDGIQTHDPP